MIKNIPIEKVLFIDIEPLKLKISKLLAEKLEVEIDFEDLD